jgi:Holliday junction resolvase-like predicted endonuclease
MYFDHGNVNGSNRVTQRIAVMGKCAGIQKNPIVRFIQERLMELIHKRPFAIRLIEIDVIAVTRDGEDVVFIEVKTRRQIPDVHSPYGRPATAVNAAKRNNLLTAVRRYIYENREAVEDLQPRIDIVEVYVDPRGDTYRVLDVKHFPNAVHP